MRLTAAASAGLVHTHLVTTISTVYRRSVQPVTKPQKQGHALRLTDARSVLQANNLLELMQQVVLLLTVLLVNMPLKLVLLQILMDALHVLLDIIPEVEI